MKNNYTIKTMYELSKERLASFQGRDVASLSPKELREYVKAIREFLRDKNRYEESLKYQEEYKQEETANHSNMRTGTGVLAGLASIGAVIGIGGCANPNIPTTEESAEATHLEQVVGYNDIDTSEMKETVDNVSSFINEALSKGLMEKKLDENNKKVLAKVALDYYLMANQNELSQETFDILNYKHDLNAELMFGNALTFGQRLQEYLPGAGMTNKLDYNKLFVNSSDAELVDKIATIVHKMHDAIVANDRATYDGLIKDAIEFKNSMISEHSDHTLFNNPVALDLALQYLDIADSLANGTIIGDTEADILNQAIERCLNGQFVSTMARNGEDTHYKYLETVANELNVQVTSDMSKEELIQAIHNSIANTQDINSLRSVYRTMYKSAIEARIEASLNPSKELNEKADDYQTVIEIIANAIDLTKQVLPEYKRYEFENANQWGPNFYQDGGAVYGAGGTKTETHISTSTSSKNTQVSRDQVPANQLVPNIDESKKADGSKTTEKHLQDTQNKLEQKGSNGKSNIDNASDQGATGKDLTVKTDNDDSNAVIDDTYKINKDYYDNHKDDKEEYTEDVIGGVEETVSTEYVYSQAAQVVDSYIDDRNATSFEEDLYNLLNDDVENIDMTMGSK